VPHREQIYARPERNLLSKRHNSFPADVSIRPLKFKPRHYPELLLALDRRILRLRPIAAANRYRQTRIFCEPRILERKLTHKESRTAIGLDAARMLAVAAEAWVRAGRRGVDHGKAQPLYMQSPYV
jgi:hypothetical protein